MTKDVLLLTCEHGGNKIPPAYAAQFRGAAKVLASHRGWDPGALPLARLMAKRLRRPLLALTWSRLLVEGNRAPHNPRVWSQFTRDLPPDERARILERYWRPHREQVERAAAALVASGKRVVHIAVHSFTPELDGEVRNADVGLLYDSSLRGERELCRRWQAVLRELDPTLRVRLNYPYRGDSDGLTTWLRRRHPATRYLGVELEINQGLVGGRRWQQFQDVMVSSVAGLIAGDARVDTATGRR